MHAYAYNFFDIQQCLHERESIRNTDHLCNQERKSIIDTGILVQRKFINLITLRWILRE